MLFLIQIYERYELFQQSVSSIVRRSGGANTKVSWKQSSASDRFQAARKVANFEWQMTDDAGSGGVSFSYDVTIIFYGRTPETHCIQTANQNQVFAYDKTDI
jgi:hypothetical protein